MAKKSDLGEQAISKAAEVGMESQLDHAENVEVDVDANPGEVLQGELEAVSVEGDGLVMQKDLRVEKLELETDGIAIDPMKAAFGDIELKRPTQADVHVVLTTQDIQRAFNSEYVQAKLRGLDVTLDGQVTKADIRDVSFQVPQKDRVALGAEVFVVQMGDRQRIAFEATPVIREGGRAVTLEGIHYGDQEEISPKLTQALIASASELLDLRNFELDDMDFFLNQIQADDGQMILKAEAQVAGFPG